MHACIDLGSNSFHLLIGTWENGKVKIVERLSEKVQLGENVGSSGKISAAAFARGTACLQRFNNIMQQYSLEQYWALGTNTFRVVDNAEEFLAAAKELGIDISIISGVQEAILIYAGVITNLPVSESHRLIIDIGGGSTEVIVGRNHSRLLTDSLPIGSVAWRDRYFSHPALTADIAKKAMLDAKDAAKKVFSAHAAAIQKLTWQEAHASSGTVKMLCNICQGQGHPSGIITLAALQEIKPLVVDAIVGNNNLSGLKESRRDLLLPGWSVLTGLMESYNIDTLNFSATALREGMMDFMVRNQKTSAVMQKSELPGVISLS